MSILFRKPVVEKAGGLTSLAKYIDADDDKLVDLIKSSGKNVVLSGEVGLQNHEPVTLYDFYKRLSRWTKMAYSTNPLNVLVVLPLFTGPLIGMATAWAVNHLFGWNPTLFFIVHVALWSCVDHMILTTIQVILHSHYYSASSTFFSIEATSNV